MRVCVFGEPVCNASVHFPYKHPTSFAFVQWELGEHNPTCTSLGGPTHGFGTSGPLLLLFCGWFAPSCLCFFVFFLVPSPAAVTSKSSPPFFLSSRGLSWSSLIIWSWCYFLPVLFKLALGLGQVRMPPPPYPLVIVSRLEANASLLCKGCTIAFPHNGYLCLQNLST